MKQLNCLDVNLPDGVASCVIDMDVEYLLSLLDIDVEL